jgi:hypothetical protein
VPFGFIYAVFVMAVSTSDDTASMVLVVVSSGRYSDWLQAGGAAVAQSVQRLATGWGSRGSSVGISTGYGLGEPR